VRELYRKFGSDPPGPVAFPAHITAFDDVVYIWPTYPTLVRGKVQAFLVWSRSEVFLDGDSLALDL